MGPFEQQVEAVLAEKGKKSKVDFWRTTDGGHVLGFKGEPGGNAKVVAGNPFVTGHKSTTKAGGKSVATLSPAEARAKAKKQRQKSDSARRKKKSKIRRGESLSESVGNTIRKQIAAIDYWAFASWGAKNFAKSDSGYELPNVSGQYEKFGPGLQFDVRGSKLSRGGRIYVLYNRGMDLYTVLGGRMTRKDGVPVWQTTAVVDRVDVESLIDVISGIVG